MIFCVCYSLHNSLENAVSEYLERLEFKKPCKAAYSTRPDPAAVLRTV